MEIVDLKRVWEKLGEQDPMWAVLTDPRRRGGRWDSEEFFATGHEHADFVLELLRKNQMSFGPYLLDFGCGLGRLSNAFAERGHQIHGVDIAESMIRGAREHNRHPDSIQFSAYSGGLLPFDDNAFDGVVTLMVLQHIPAHPKLLALAELIRVTRPGGVLVVQLVDEIGTETAPLAAQDSRASIEILDSPHTMSPGETASVRVSLTNTGAQTWVPGADIKLGNHWSLDGKRIVLDDGRTALTEQLRPSGKIELDLVVKAPNTSGDYILEVDVVQEFVRWFEDAGSMVQTRRISVGESTTAEPTRTASQESSSPSYQGSGGIEMHPMSETLLRNLSEYLSADVVAIERDPFGGAEWLSCTYVLRVRD